MDQAHWKCQLPHHPFLLAWIPLCLSQEGLPPPFPSSPHRQPVPAPCWGAEKCQSTAGGGNSSPKALGSLVFAAVYLGCGARGTLLLCAQPGQLSNVLEKWKENPFCCIERVHRPINPAKNTNLPNLLLGVGARVVLSLVWGMLSFMDPIKKRDQSCQALD